MLIPLLHFACARQSFEQVKTPAPDTGNKNSKVIELRNYLIKTGEAQNFNTLFSEHFLKPMQEMGVSILGKYKIKDSDDHFVWIRGYENMEQRVTFLNDFYYRNEEWKKYKKNANEIIRNSDNVYLLRPLDEAAMGNPFSGPAKSFVVIDFYTANSRLDELTDFYTKEYLPILKSLNFEISLWVSETTENDFPQLPVFQDKNLLVAITFFESEKEYNTKLRKLKSQLPESMKIKMLDIVTVHHQMLLNNFN
jgi:hypothetical protein